MGKRIVTASGRAAVVSAMAQIILSGGASATTWRPFSKKTSEQDLKLGAQIKKVDTRRSQKTVTVDLQIPGFSHDLVEKNGETFAALKIPNYGFTNEAGRPQLPVIRKVVEVSSSKVELKIANISEATEAKENAGIRNEIFPAQEPVAKVPGAFEEAAFVKDAGVYSTDAFYPAETARIVARGTLRGHPVVTIEVAPIRYNPVTHQLKYVRSIQLELKASEVDDSDEEDRSYGTSLDQASLMSVLGYDAGEMDSDEDSDKVNEESPSTQPTTRPVGSPDPWTVVRSQERLLVIVGKSFEANLKLKEFVTWKRMRGYVVDVKLASNLGADAKSVRTYIRDLYSTTVGTEAPLTYVLLVGDVDLIPTYKSGKHVTDNYYAAVDKEDYLSDRTFPDLGVGRLPVKTVAELETILRRLITYERAVFRTTRWIKKIAFIATDDRYKVAEATHQYVIDTYTKPKNYLGSFPSYSQAGGDELFAITNKATTDDVMKSVNDGRSIVTYSGHGAPSYWAGPYFGSVNVNALTHPDARPYVMSHACVSGSFGGPIDSFGEIWLKARLGAIGFWGTTDSSYWDEDDILERHFFDGLFKNKMTNVSMLNLYGLEGVRAFYNNAKSTPYYYEIYNLQGDPTLSLYTEVPRVLESTVTWNAGDNQAHVQVSNLTVEAATLVATNPRGDVLAVAHTDRFGAATLKLPMLRPSPAQKLKLTVTAPNAIPLVRDLP